MFIAVLYKMAKKFKIQFLKEKRFVWSPTQLKAQQTILNGLSTQIYDMEIHTEKMVARNIILL